MSNPMRRLKVLEVDFETGTATIKLSDDLSVGACVDVAVYEQNGRLSITPPPGEVRAKGVEQAQHPDVATIKAEAKREVLKEALTTFDDIPSVGHDTAREWFVEQLAAVQPTPSKPPSPPTQGEVHAAVELLKRGGWTVRSQCGDVQAPSTQETLKRVVGFDRGSPGGDQAALVEMEQQSDGSMLITRELRGHAAEDEIARRESASKQESLVADTNPYYGKDCPVGMVQVEFVGCSPAKRAHDYGWKPTERTFLEVYVDGKRFRIDVGDYHDGHGQRRGLHIITDCDVEFQKTALNACSLFLKAGQPTCAECGSANVDDRGNCYACLDRRHGTACMCDDCKLDGLQAAADAARPTPTALSLARRILSPGEGDDSLEIRRLSGELARLVVDGAPEVDVDGLAKHIRGKFGAAFHSWDELAQAAADYITHGGDRT